MPMSPLPSRDSINRFFVLSGLWVTLHVSVFTTQQAYSTLAVALWTLATTVSYAFLYLLPALLPGYLLHGFLARRAASRGGVVALAILLIGLTGMVQVLLFADRVIYGMYGFHINGFVLDLVFTPGGIASLGASRSTELTATLVVIALLALQAATYYWATRRTAGRRPRRWMPRARWLLLAVLSFAVGERVAYGFSAAANYQPILFASERYPLYLPTTFRKLASRLGVSVASEAADGLHVKHSVLNYPLVPLRVEPPARPLNIVWLAVESLRYDLLDRTIMPQLWDFSEHALRLEQHYSGGNTTQMGIFSMFYGLYGNYWFPMQAARRSPLLMDVLQQQNYQFSLHTSQSFTYPPFQETVFARMNPADMHALSEGPPAWQRDRQNIDDILKFIDSRDQSRPFMTYMFFEGTHANYTFPPESVIARPYLEDFNYLSADFAQQMVPIKNRYINAAHHVDQQIGRIIAHLRTRKLLDDTIVIVLGDHGEEFMERGRWGHAADFNRFQTSTVAVLWVPGQNARRISGISSHLDLPATLMPLLGVQNPPADYSLGQNLLAADFHRDYAVAAGWNRIAYLGEKFKISFPVNASGVVRVQVLDDDDRPVSDRDQAKSEIRPAMVEMMNNLTRFSRPKG
jgi:membrane-anchored protein YejM (alkaline phosphatase superfamily)